MTTIKNRIKQIRPEHLEQSVQALFLMVIVLQVVDALSTFWALSTGLAHEQNHLLIAISHYSRINVMWVVVAAKLVVASVFVVAMKKNKPTWGSLAVMFFMSAFYINVVSDNIALTWKILDGWVSY